MNKEYYIFSIILILLLESCNFKKSNNEIVDTIKCPVESSMIIVEGDLFLDSKRNVFLDTKYNGKFKLIMSDYDYIYRYYDDFLSIKNFDEKTCKVRIFGHYLEPIDTTDYLNYRREFHLHTITCIDSFEESKKINVLLKLM